MKRILSILLLAVSLPVMAASAPATAAPKQVSLTVNWRFLNIEEGYDHDSRCEVYVDGNLVGTSTVTKESIPNSITVNMSKGTHTVKIINYAYYDGTWEAHTVANNYSIDCSYEVTANYKKKKNTLSLVFDINTGTSLDVE